MTFSPFLFSPVQQIFLIRIESTNEKIKSIKSLKTWFKNIWIGLEWKMLSDEKISHNSTLVKIKMTLFVLKCLNLDIQLSNTNHQTNLINSCFKKNTQCVSSLKKVLRLRWQEGFKSVIWKYYLRWESKYLVPLIVGRKYSEIYWYLYSFFPQKFECG